MGLTGIAYVVSFVIFLLTNIQVCFIFGCLILQIWAYEAIPQLGNTCALITGKVTVPRCLKWSFRGFRHWKRIDFAKNFEQEVLTVAFDTSICWRKMHALIVSF